MSRPRHPRGYLNPLLLLLLAMLGLALPGHALVLLDDVWADNSRNEQNLPGESAWFASTGLALTAAPGSMSLALGGSAVQCITYFTTNLSSLPVTIGVGETLLATFRLTFSGLAAPNGSQGFRIGLFNFADSTNNPKRVTEDGFGSNTQGTNVQGYALFQNIGTAFNNASPMDVRKRTTLADGALLGTSGNWTSLATGPGNTNTFPGFANGILYLLRVALSRADAGSLSLSVTWSNTATGATLSVSVTDSNSPCLSFDAIALRPQNAASSASSIVFSRVKMELITPDSGAPTIVTQPQSQTVAGGQDAMFGIVADGDAPLSYQWYFNTNTPLGNATGATLTLTNVTASDEGFYSVVVTNSAGSVTSTYAALTVTNLIGPALTIQASGGTATLTFAAEPGYDYEVQRSTNLLDWIVLLTTNAPEGGLIQVVDDFSDLAGPPAEAYYRLRLIPLVFTAPSIDTQPQDQTVILGQAATFTVVAAGTAPLRYQWYFNGTTPLPNATNATLTLNSVQESDGGGYAVVVTNHAGSVTSSVATLTVLVPPTISSQPTNQTVVAGQSASFTVVATGTATLHYQWYFNTNTLLAGATNATLTLTNVQTTNAGDYSVVVTNSAGAVTSGVAVLTVVLPPAITTQPTNQTVAAGQDATFGVVATGTPPLHYQWYFNTNTPLAGATNTTLTLTNVQATNAGGYSVRVTNSFASVTSTVATLTVNASNGAPDFSLVGFANVNGTVTGGQGGSTVTVTTATDFKNYVGQNSPYIVQVQGTINLGTGSASVKSRKTILGLGTNATLIGTLNISGSSVSNVVVRNLHLTNPNNNAGTGDAITIQSSAHHIWIDRCTFYDCADGALDITQQADYVTVSWCKFYYTTNTGHNFVNLIGSSDTATDDRGKLRVTFHHNWWSTLCIERMPRVRFGDVHVFNNYFYAPGNNYCVRAAIESEVLIENNYFRSVKNPWEIYVTTGTAGKIRAADNLLVNTTGTTTPGDDIVFTPPYAYTTDPAASVPNLVTNYAGAGRSGF